jgi:hypothetical protein
MNRLLALTLALCLAGGSLQGASKQAKKKAKAKPAPVAAQAPEPDAAAVVELVDGKVSFSMGSGKWAKVTLGMSLHKLDRLKTGGNGKVKLSTPEGASVALGPNTEISLSSLSSPSQPRTALQLVSGFLRALIDKKLEKRSFEVFRNNGVAAVKGTDLVCSAQGDALQVQVLSSAHSGVSLGGWDGSSTLIRPGEYGVLGPGGAVNSAPLTQAQLNQANTAFAGLIPPQLKLITPPASPPPVTPKLSAAAMTAAVQKTVQAAYGSTMSDAAKASLVTSLLSSGAGPVLIEHLLTDASQGTAQTSAFLAVAQSQGANVDLSAIPTPVPVQTAPPSPAPGSAPAATPAPSAPSSGSAPPTPNQAAIMQEVQSNIADLKQEIATNANADQAALHNDMLAGNTWIDHNGYQAQVTQLVLRPDPNTVDKVISTIRTAGPDAGTSMFSHSITFNQALPLDWTTIYSRNLNDPDNLALTGSPEYWKTFEQISFASPTGCKACLFDTYGPPQDVTNVVTNVTGWAQDDLRQYSVMGLNRGTQQFYATGQAASGDSITYSSVATADNAWTITYTNNTLGVQIFTAKVWLMSAAGIPELPLNFGNLGTNGNLNSFNILESGYIHEIQLTAPEFLGTDIDVLIPSDVFLEAF